MLFFRLASSAQLGKFKKKLSINLAIFKATNLSNLILCPSYRLLNIFFFICRLSPLFINFPNLIISVLIRSSKYNKTGKGAWQLKNRANVPKWNLSEHHNDFPLLVRFSVLHV